MMAQNPNLRAVKPLSKYLDLTVRMLGRQRLALEHATTGNNQVVVNLPFTPDCPETLEIYLDGVRVVDGYTINKFVVTFSKPMNGTLTFVSDTQIVDTGLKWLEIPVANLIQSNDPTTTAYGTDRTTGHQVATFVKPLVISQGGIGFCRPSEDNSKLLYSSLYGRFGRDTLTYALLSDAGQLSDYRCIDIRVRDPNYIPPIRILSVAKFSAPVRVNGVVMDNTDTSGEWTTYAEAGTNALIEMPNKTTIDGMFERHFVMQGRDEEGKWFELAEYFDPGEYKINLTYPEGAYTVTAQGSSAEFGFDNAERLSIMFNQTNTDAFRVEIEVENRVIFSCSIRGRAVQTIPVAEYPRTIDDVSFTYNKDPENTNDSVEWNIDGEESSPYGMTTTTTFKNEAFESHRVEVDFKGTVTFTRPLYDPITAQMTQTVFDVSRVVTGRFVTAEDPDENLVIAPNASMNLLNKTMLWDSASPWSDMFYYEPLTFTYTNKWSIP